MGCHPSQSSTPGTWAETLPGCPIVSGWPGGQRCAGMAGRATPGRATMPAASGRVPVSRWTMGCSLSTASSGALTWVSTAARRRSDGRRRATSAGPAHPPRRCDRADAVSVLLRQGRFRDFRGGDVSESALKSLGSPAFRGVLGDMTTDHRPGRSALALRLLQGFDPTAEAAQAHDQPDLEACARGDLIHPRWWPRRWPSRPTTSGTPAYLCGCGRPATRSRSPSGPATQLMLLLRIYAKCVEGADVLTQQRIQAAFGHRASG